jgi:dihydrolipoamide dehydrogenase
MNYDLIVIGAGPAGYVAAIRAAQLGLKTALVERDHLGGICLNWGCIPTKSMLHGVELSRAARSAAKLQLQAQPVAHVPAVGELAARARQDAATLSGGIGYLLRKNRVDLIWGRATICAPGELEVTAAPVAAPKGALGEGRYRATHLVVATGASPRRLPGLEPDEQLIWSYRGALSARELPATLAIIGSGAIGVEFADLYAGLGSSVTLIEALGQVLPQEDAEVSQAIGKALAKKGIAIRTGCRVERVDAHKDRLTLRLSDGTALDASRVLVAAGVVPNIDGLGLQALGVPLSSAGIQVDAVGRTGVAGLYAIGDVAGAPMLAHKAEHDAIRCVEAICGREVSAEPHAIPSCVFTDPEVASIGLTEQAAREAGLALRIGRFGLRGNGKAVVLAHTEGFVKLLFDAHTDRLLGAHLVGPKSSELIHGLSLAMTLGATSRQLSQAVFPHPTLSEAIHEAVLAARDGAIHA